MADNSAVVPAEDLNAPSPPLPPGYEADIPAALKTLMDRLDDVREELSRLASERWRPIPMVVRRGKTPYKSNVRREMELDQQVDKLNREESALMAQIRELRALCSPPGSALSASSKPVED